MTSISRKILRRQLRKNGRAYVGKRQFVKPTPDGGYVTLHPTKGWVKTSGKRVKVYSS